MSHNQRKIADLLFGVQIVLTFFFCFGQFRHMWLYGTENISMPMFICIEAFVLLNWLLSLGAYRENPTRVAKQGVGIYSVWVVLWSANLMLALWEGSAWSRDDHITSALVIVGVVIVLGVARAYDRGIKDPSVRGYLSLVCKAVPQLAQAWKIVLFEGAAGIGWFMILGGHLTILVRISQLIMSYFEKRGDPNRKGLLISEIGNEVSWIVVTIVWLIY